MKVSMAYKYRLVVSKSQKQLLLNHIFAHNQAWNILLNESIKQLEFNKLRVEQGLEPIYLSNVDQDNLVKSILKNRNITFNSKVVQQTRQTFNDSLKQTIKNFKSGKSNQGMLNFKQSKNFNNQSFETTKEQYSVLDSSNPKFKILRLFRENFKIRWTRDFPIDSKLSNVNFTFKDNSFYVSFNISYESNRMIDSKNIDTSYLKPLGMDINIDSIDLGNKLFHKSFNIKDIKSMNLISKNEKKIKRLQRKQSRRLELSAQSEQAELVRKKKKIKLSKNFNKTQNKINKISTKNSNKKVFQLHKIVNEILSFMKENNYNHIVMENLDVKEMTSKDNINKTIGKNKSKTMNKNILQISFAMFKKILTYKCAMNGVYVSLVDPKNTSKSCSCCGNVNEKLNLTNRIYNCAKCGASLKRDHNSTINILNKYSTN